MSKLNFHLFVKRAYEKFTQKSQARTLLSGFFVHCSDLQYDSPNLHDEKVKILIKVSFYHLNCFRNI